MKKNKYLYFEEKPEIGLVGARPITNPTDKEKESYSKKGFLIPYSKMIIPPEYMKLEDGKIIQATPEECKLSVIYKNKQIRALVSSSTNILPMPKWIKAVVIFTCLTTILNSIIIVTLFL